MSGETIVTVEADQVVVVTDSVPPPGVADVAAAVDQARQHRDDAQAARNAAQAVLLDPNFQTVVGLQDEIATVALVAGAVVSVAENTVNINAVAGSIANVNAVAADLVAINAVHANAEDIDAVAADLANVDAVAGGLANVNTVAGAIANVNDVAGSIANVNAVAADLANVDTVATNIAAVNDASTNMAAIVAAPTHAAAAAQSEANAQASEEAAGNSASLALAVYGTTADLNAAQQIMLGYANTATAQANLAASSAASAASVLQQDLSAISAQLHYSPNAIVALFVYDTSKDSDGGAWVDKCQNTSWYQESLNGTWLGGRASEAAARAVSGATTGDYFQLTTDGKFYKLNAGSGTTEVFRGNKRKFPRLAAIVAEAASITIYDLTEAGRPMWMRFATPDANTGVIGWASAGAATVSSIHMVGGRLVVVGSGAVVVLLMDFAKEDVVGWSTAGYYSIWPKSLAQRNGATSYQLLSASQAIANNTVNAVAMTVLPDAPVDPVTGLQVPTIAVGTAAGLSVIQTTGSVVSSSSTSNFAYVNITEKMLSAGIANAASVYYALSPGALAAGFALATSMPTQFATGSLSGAGVKQPGRSLLVKSASAKLQLMKFSEATTTASAVAELTDTYATGWMTGAILRCLLANTNAGTVVDTNLVTNGAFDTATTGWSSYQSGVLSVDAGRLLVTNGGAESGAAYQSFATVVGRTYRFSVVPTYGTSGTAILRIGNSIGGTTNLNVSNPGTGAAYETSFVATGATTIVTLYTGSVTVGQTCFFDNVVVREVIADRSYKNKPATVYGTLTKTAVATAAQLMFFSGWSATNYAQEPYSSDLDFPGEWSASAVVSIPATLPGDNFPTPGAEVVTNGGFDTDTWWAKNTGVTIADGVAHFTAADSASLYRAVGTIGKRYKVVFTIKNYVAGGVRVAWSTTTGASVGTTRTANGTYTEYITADNTTLYFTSQGGPTTLDLDDVSVKELDVACITERAAATGPYIKLGVDGVGKLVAEAYDGTSTRRVTSTAAYNTATALKVRANYQTSGTLSLQVNGETVASATGTPLLTLNNASAVLTIGNSRALDAPFPGSIALLKIGATVPTAEQSQFMWAQESRLFQPGAQCCLPASTAVVDMSYDDALDLLTVKQAANMSQFHGLVRVATATPSAGSFTKTATRGGVRLMARSTTNPGVDVVIPAYGLREELVNRSLAAARLARLDEPLDYSGGFTANTTNGSTALASVAGWTYPPGVNPRGAVVKGTGIPAGAYITDVVGTTVYISGPATATNTGVQIALTDFPLPAGFEAKSVLTDGTQKQEGATKAYTKRFDGFKETPRYGTEPGYSAWVHIKARRVA